MEDIRRIEQSGITYAIIFRKDIEVENSMRFPTSNENALQVGFFERPAGYASPPHRHIPRTLTIEHPAEFLSIEQGKVAVTVFDEEWQTVGEREISAGECIVFLRGGHSLTVLEPARILEVKQGPYIPHDKIFRPSA